MKALLVCMGARRLKALEIRRAQFAVLAAVAGLVPVAGDLEGRASGLLSVEQIAEAANIPLEQVRWVLVFFRTWRVLWLRLGKTGGVEVRFQRRIVVGLLAAQRVVPLEVKKLLAAHRRKREAIAPRRKAVLLQGSSEQFSAASF
ncbi:MAG: hypothetical protein LAN84_12190 [Acidobacteriia bacterium]|nr:hypothetical protein [Terriglobia bacterium]